MAFKPFKHQETAIQLFKKNKGILACFLKQGTGKTFVTIECFKFIQKQIPSAKLVVICPLSLIIYNSWESDINKFSDFKVFDLHSNIDNVDRTSDIYLANYEMLRSPRKFQIIKDILSYNECMFVLDESSFIKSATGVTSKRVLSLRHLSKYKMCLSGTPAPNSELEFWAQITFLKDGVLPKSFHVFKNEYSDLVRGKQVISGDALKMLSYSKQNAQKMFKQGFKYIVNEDKKKLLLEQIKPFSIFVKKSDCHDLVFTEQSFIPRMMAMGKKQSEIYHEMKKHMIIEINQEEIVANMAMKKIMKLRQITSGFIYGDDSRHIIGDSIKIKALKYDVERFGNEQIIIWANFTQEIEMIKDLLGNKAGCVYGGVNVTEKQKNIEQFKSGAIQYLVANPQSISHGLTFLNSHYQIFYSLTDSYERMDQAKDRDHRIGQLKDCMYYYYICKGTVDELIWDNVKNKESAENFVHKFLNS